MAKGAMKDPEQLLLELPFKEALAEEDFLPSKPNEEAIAWIGSWPDWKGGHCLILYGPQGCGKTHLCHVWQKMTGAQVIKFSDLHSFDFTNSEEFLIIIEDVLNDLDKNGNQEKLLHIYNWVKEEGGYLLLTSTKHPKKWETDLADLSSRMLAANAVKIKHPDDELLKAIIVKQFADRQVKISEKVVNYIMKNTERSFSAIRALVSKIDEISMAEKKKITTAIVKKALGEEVKE